MNLPMKKLSSRTDLKMRFRFGLMFLRRVLADSFSMRLGVATATLALLVLAFVGQPLEMKDSQKVFAARARFESAYNQQILVSKRIQPPQKPKLLAKNLNRRSLRSTSRP